jgi:MFS family permease
MHILRNGRLIHRKLLIILAVTLLWWIADFAVEFSFPTYLEGSGKSYLEIGALLSIAAFSGLLIDLPMGALSDRTARGKLMIAGLSLAVVSIAMIFSSGRNAVLTASFFAWGIAFQMWRVPRDAFFAAQTDHFDRGQEYGLDMEVKYIGQSVGPVAAGFILAYAGFHSIVGFYGILLLLGIMILAVCLREKNHHTLAAALNSCAAGSLMSSSFRELKAMGTFSVVLLCFALLFTAWEQVLLTFQPLFYGPDVLNMPPQLGGLLMASFSLPGIFLAYPCGRLADKYGKRQVLTSGLLVMGAGLVLFSTSQSVIHAFASALLTSVGWVLSLPALNGLIIDLAAGHKKGCVAGLWDLFMDLGFVSGPLMGGLLAQLYGVKSAFLAMGAVFLASTLLLCLHRQPAAANEPAAKRQ